MRRTGLPMSDRLFVLLQYLLPQQLLSRVVGALARSRLGLVRRPLVALFLRGYRPDLAEALEPEARAYPSFNALFTRALRPGVRPIAGDASVLVSPVDGRISDLGISGAARAIRAKGHDYSLATLLAGDRARAAQLADGPCMTIYLAPFNYHRIHMPFAGKLVAADYVPGRLFSVNAVTARFVPGLFARNERLVLHFESAHGPWALVFVGALFVGSMGTVWHGDVIARPGRQPVALPMPAEAARSLARGAEVGRFNMGSTVVLLLPRGTAAWQGLSEGQAVRVGEALGRWPVAG
jgi:phosphatidylserine decarboxylase